MSDVRPLVVDDVLSARDFARFRAAIASEAMIEGTHWIDAAKRPDDLIEHVVAALRRVARPDRWLVGAEWWLRREPSPVAKRLHFDKDEALAARGEYVHPPLASVFYVSDTGGPTLITDQRCSRDGRTMIPEEPRHRVVVRPRENRYLVFDGTLRHGVLPARDASEIRTTFLVNWWDRPLGDAERRRVSSEQLGSPR